jgi:transcriptional regulator with XRE-family HTH domain
MIELNMDELMELYRSGLSQEQIAQRFRTTQPTISRRLRTYTRQKAWFVKAGESGRIEALKAERDKWKFCADETYEALTALHEKLEEWKARALKAEDKLQKITELAEGWREAHADR